MTWYFFPKRDLSLSDVQATIDMISADYNGKPRLSDSGLGFYIEADEIPEEEQQILGLIPWLGHRGTYMTTRELAEARHM